MLPCSTQVSLDEDCEDKVVARLCQNTVGIEALFVHTNFGQVGKMLNVIQSVHNYQFPS
jgi:hypothetical protein